jgi:hypothetical protein
VAFLYISDDMEWGRKNVKNNHNDLHFVGTGNGDIDEDVAYDFALLAYRYVSIATLLTCYVITQPLATL